jgi:hypothetical protein
VWWAREECPGKAISSACIYKPADRRVLSLKDIPEQLQTELQSATGKTLLGMRHDGAGLIVDMLAN